LETDNFSPNPVTALWQGRPEANKRLEETINRASKDSPQIGIACDQILELELIDRLLAPTNTGPS
jgi:hypothetical protein